MAKLNALPDSEVRAACTGLVDFYYWKGIPCARKWPDYKPREPQPEELQNQQRFTVVAVATGAIDTFVKDRWRALEVTDATTWVDVFRATGLGGGWLRDGR